MQACLLIYDVPVLSRVKNPSAQLRRFGVRVNLSCWVIQHGDIPYSLLDRMAAGGATWHVVRFDAGEGEKLLGMAIEALKRDIRDAMRRARLSADRANDRLDGTDETPAEATRRHARQAAAIVRRMSRLLTDLRSAAERFGIGDDTLALATVATGVNALQAAMQTRARLYAEAATQVRQLAGGRDPMADAADADQVPAAILADYVEDNGGEAGALREAFAGE